MASVRKFVFGSAPFRFLAEHLAQDKDFIDDAKRILKLDQDQYLRLVAQLDKSNEFINRSILGSITMEALGDTDDAKQIAAIIYRLASTLYRADIPVEKAMDSLAEAIQEHAKGIKPDERKTLSERIRALALEPSGVARQHKAERLAALIGAELDDFQFVCDIRPIFDKKRERIEGALPIATLQLEYTEPDGESKILEMRVTQKQIASLETKFAEIKRKIKVVIDSLEGQKVPIPITEATEKD